MQDQHHRPALRRISVTITALLCAGLLMAQSSPKPTAPAANLNQLMRSLFFPHSNVVFFTQRYDPKDVKPASEPSASTDPCLLYTSPSPRDRSLSRMPSSA